MIDVHLVNAFVDGGAGGNPAGVVPDAGGLSSAQKQAIARRVGFSETAFVSPSATETVKLEFFTPERQIPHCGHATIATFWWLREHGRIADGALSKETIDGPRPIVVRDGQVFMGQRAPRYTPLGAGTRDHARLLAALGLSTPSLWAGFEPEVVDTGNRFLLVPLPDEAAVRDLQPDVDAIRSLSEDLDLVGLYPFSTEARLPGRAAGARMFAPRFGIQEEAATGMAAGPLAAWLHDRLGLGPRLTIEQGQLMQPPSPSVIEVTLELGDDGQIAALWAGGRARAVGVKRIDEATGQA